jgi:hypothetical protein
LAGLALYGSIAAAVLRDAPLDGLVNNAGIAVAGPVELAPLERWRTPLWDNSARNAERAIRPAKWSRRCTNCPAGWRVRSASWLPAGRGPVPVEEVVKAVERALTSARPRTRYPVGRDAKLRPLLKRVPDRWILQRVSST